MNAVYNTVAKLLESPDRWCQGASARNEKGDGIYSESPDACRWCIAGAILRIYGSLGCPAVYEKMQDALGLKRTDSLILFNDNRKTTHEQILAAAKKAGI